jgi:hypothetical protein
MLAQTWRAVDDPDKKAFFRNFGLIFSPWHFLLLVLVLIAKALDPWVRDAM